jgi:hypothetical protein
MVAPAVLVVFLISSQSMDRTAAPFEHAAREVLGASSALQVEASPEPLSDADALDRAGAADGIVELTWNADRRSAVLHCYVSGEKRWVDRVIHFDLADRDVERGRLLGFAVASMFVDAPVFAEARAHGAASDAVLARSAAPSMPAPAHARVTPVTATPDTGSGLDESAAAQLVPWQGRATRSLEFVGVAVTGSGQSGAAEVGASAALGISLSEALWLRVQLGGRAGELPAAQANVRRVVAGVGLAWDVLSEASSLELRLRVDALGSWLQVSHLSNDDATSVKDQRWLAGADTVATLGYRFSTRVTFYTGAGLEALSGSTHVSTHGVERATLPGWRALAEAGFRTHF